MTHAVRLDTHVVAWLYAGSTDKLSPAAIEAVESAVLTISPMVELELTYLHEIGRIALGGADVVADLRTRLPLAVSDVPFSSVVHAAAGLTWTRDPFDRMILGDALAANTPLLTKDDTLLKRTPLALW
ncbi:MAG: type II toxin-antitoxin system VapC family toxin [Nocardioides sp.]